MRPVGVALIGTGFMGRTHLEALRRLPGVVPRGILGSTPLRSEAAARDLGLERSYRSLRELLADSDVQAVHVNTPNDSHFELVRGALESGKHVLCEKPLALTSEESRQLLGLARARPKLACAVNYNVRFYPLCIEARDRIARGELGEIFHVSGSYLQDWLNRPSDTSWRVESGRGGELRAVSDIGTHWLDLVQWITGLEVNDVLADLKTQFPRRPRMPVAGETFATGDAGGGGEEVEVSNEDHGAILLRFREDVRGCLQVSQVAAGRKNCIRFEISGSRGTLAWNSESPDELWIGRREVASERLMRDPSLLGEPARRATELPGGHGEGYPDTFKQCFRAFYEAIRRGEPESSDFPTFEDGHREMVICDAISRSHRERRWIELEN